MRPGHLALREPTLWRYDDVLPVDNPDYRVSLGEGFTPLLGARRLGRRSASPASSSRTRAATPPAPSRPAGWPWPCRWRRSLGATDVCLPSAGNAGSALGAYAARGGLRPTSSCPRTSRRCS